tara:strand:- start:2433 stop:3002 length:570 start_codon:yes stop_codon:yes gene_type:complete
MPAHGYVSVYINARSTSRPQTKMLEYFHRAHDYKDIVDCGQPRRSLGFCFNTKCQRSKPLDFKEIALLDWPDQRKFEIEKVYCFKRKYYTGMNLELDMEVVECKECKHALHWSFRWSGLPYNEYKQKEEAYFLAKKMNKEDKVDFNKIPVVKIKKKPLEKPKPKPITDKTDKITFVSSDSEGGGWGEPT